MREQRGVRRAGERGVEVGALWGSPSALPSRGADGGASEFVGNSPLVREALASLPPIARARRTTLIGGPTGSGKEVVAQLLHRMGQVPGAPYVAVHCATLPEQLAEAELFGHTRGAFTGALHARSGIIKSAEGGTLFLDEIDSLSLTIQAKLLRFLESGEVRAVGSDRVDHTSSWVLAATNRDLRTAVREGKFRADLLYRLEIMSVVLPALRARGADIELLAHHFANRSSPPGTAERRFAPCALAAMRAHDWPGNVRELKHKVERAALLSENGTIRAKDLGLGPAPAESLGSARDLAEPVAPPAAAPLRAAEEPAALSRQLWKLVEQDGLSLAEAIELCERTLIEAALRAERDNRSRAADRLRIHVRTIFKKLTPRT